MLPLLDWCVGKGVCAMAELVLGGVRGWGGLCLWPEQPWGPCGLQSGPCSAAGLHSVPTSSRPRVQPPTVPSLASPGASSGAGQSLTSLSVPCS